MRTDKYFETDGTHNGAKVYCPVNACYDCPYCDEEGVCHISDPVRECDDFFLFFASWEEWEQADEVDENAPEDFSADEIAWAERNLDYDGTEDYPDDEIGFNPYMGCYDYDC